MVPAKDYADNERVVSSEGFVIDSSPPVSGQIVINGILRSSYFVHNSFISLRLEDFYDHHSGIGHYNVGIGSRVDVTDVLQFQKYLTNKIEIVLFETNIIDGHYYYFIVQVFINAYSSKPDKLVFFLWSNYKYIFCY